MDVDKPSAHEFSGIISQEDILLMDAAIKDGCGQIDPEDWETSFDN